MLYQRMWNWCCTGPALALFRHATLGRRAGQVTDIARLIEPRVVRYMREATLVPEHKVADAPTVAVNKFILKAMREQLFEQRAGIGFVVPLDGDHRMLRVGEERLTAGLWMGADDWMYGQRCPGPQIVIQLAPEFSLRVIPPGQINTTPPLQRLTEPFGQPVSYAAYALANRVYPKPSRTTMA